MGLLKINYQARMKVIIVTGASRGIGAATVDRLCSTPEVVVVGVARAETKLQELKARHGKKFDYVVGDVTDERVVQAVIDKVSSGYGRLDAVVANAGVAGHERIEDADIKEWRRLFEINLFSVVNLASKALPLLRKSQGAFLVVSSMLSQMGVPAVATYASSKIALNHFAMILAMEEPEIRTIALDPGVAQTDMLTDGLNAADQAAGTQDNAAREMMRHVRVASPDEPGTVLAALAAKGIPEELNGKFVVYDSEELAAYTKL
ncbi:ABR248Wp [Eremothecium gossypii ATCC 10895]|uniref:ABR248Wp n=1 Tax=Eremothecium gossypii (strain ATCC 10895 / CBS 109.51 / FGSC 9923 / NRRL Y-1056) TaxID=284811 RepID=Q75DB1_EREGS|nr:ABR248Wp [Eremothecium gossypii ATCC 10895]AAS51021.1 ABR248Wp [Eremothecium gossypii ATCC 10895]AEY95310.1 FABR248Wp [Eremothecium gossypii FDAG1]